MAENLLLFQAVNLYLLLNSTSSVAAKKYERHDEKLLYHKISHNPPTHYSMFSLQHPQFLVFFSVYYSMLRLVSNMAVWWRNCAPHLSYFLSYFLCMFSHFHCTLNILCYNQNWIITALLLQLYSIAIETKIYFCEN